MAAFGHLTSKRSEDISSTEKIQKILDELGANMGVKKALLVSEEGFPIMSARTAPITDEIETLVSAMVAGIVSTFSGACIQLDLGSDIEYINVKTPLGLGLMCSVGATILVLITSSDVRIGLMQYLLSTNREKMLKVRDF